MCICKIEKLAKCQAMQFRICTSTMSIRGSNLGVLVELVSKELNHLAAILHVYAGGLSFMK